MMKIFKSSLLEDKLFHMKMLRLWEECNPNHKVDYCLNEVDQELGSEVNAIILL